MAISSIVRCELNWDNLIGQLGGRGGKRFWRLRLGEGHIRWIRALM